MQKVVAKVVVFFLGVAVAAIVVADLKQSKNKSILAKKINNLGLVNSKTRASLSSDPQKTNELFQLSDDFRNFLSSLPEEKQNALFRAAVIEGSYSSVQKISSRILNSLPNYQSIILPDLKKQALSQLLNRFREKDWMDWANSSFANDGEPTLAKSYVGTISLVNSELATYLETAAYLLSALYHKTLSGEEFILDREFEELSQVYESKEKYSEEHSRLIFDANILGNLDFQLVLEKAKRNFVLRFVKQNPENLLANLNLILSLKKEAVEKEELDLLELMIRKFALDASAKYREEVFKVIGNSTSINEFVKINSGLRQSLAQLYVVGALDGVEGEDLRKANVYLDQSISIYPKLRSQEILADYIKYGYQNNELKSPRKVNSKKEDSEFDSRLKNYEKNSSESEVSQLMNKSLSSLLKILGIVISLGLTSIAIVYLWGARSRKEEEEGQVEDQEAQDTRSYTTKEHESSKELPASTEIDFEKEFQIGRRANFD